MLLSDWMSSRNSATSELPFACNFLDFAVVGLVVVDDVDERGPTEYDEGMVLEEEGK